MDRGVREAAGYQQGRNCVSGAHCQKYVCIIQLEQEGEKGWTEQSSGQNTVLRICRNDRGEGVTESNINSKTQNFMRVSVRSVEAPLNMMVI